MGYIGEHNEGTMGAQWGHNGGTMGAHWGGQWGTMGAQWGHNGAVWGHPENEQWGHNAAPPILDAVMHSPVLKKYYIENPSTYTLFREL